MNPVPENLTQPAGLEIAMHPHLPTLCAGGIDSYQQGLRQLEMGEPGDALASFSHTLELAPNFVPAHILAGIANARRSSIYPALDHLERAVEIDPECFAGHYMLAELNFKLRIPVKGYASAKRALECAATPPQRAAVAQLIREERQREHSGIARPWFNKPFTVPAMLVLGSGLAALIVAVLTHLR